MSDSADPTYINFHSISSVIGARHSKQISNYDTEEPAQVVLLAGLKKASHIRHYITHFLEGVVKFGRIVEDCHIGDVDN